MIVGTAGHIDHGKTSLVRALTGIDTDRLKEERARGITIELGFAHAVRASGRIASFIDMPGHERLVHTMLAGASGIDMVLLAVAADDGIMPQTREHVAIIDLLGIERGIVALTKCDLVVAERRKAVERDLVTFLADTSLSGAEVIPVSTVTSEGIAALDTALDRASEGVTKRTTSGRFRLAIDRSFTLAGAGTVVTGTALSGAVAVGDRVVISPGGHEARVRSIHAENRPAERGSAGQRCALALSGAKISTETTPRGAVVVDPELHRPVTRLDARIRVLASERKALSQSMPVKLHHAAAERVARMTVLSDQAPTPGEHAMVQLAFDDPLALACGDRIVLRDVSATRTIGGGSIVDLRPPERGRKTPVRRAELEALAIADPIVALPRILDGERRIVDIDAFSRDRAAAAYAADAWIAALSLTVLRAGDSRHVCLPEAFSAYADNVVQELARFHADKPELPGLGQERLRLAMKPRLAAPVFASALAQLVERGRVVLDRSWVRLPTHEVRLTADEARLWDSIRPMIDGDVRFKPPRVRDISKARSLDEADLRRLFKRAARRGDVDEIANDHYFLSTAVIEMADIARDLAAMDPSQNFTVIEFRDRLDNGRKVAIQILEFFDRQGLTMRRGDIRRINPHKAQLFTRAAEPPTGDPATRAGGVSSPVGRPDFKSGEGRETALGGFDSCLLRQSSP